MIMMIITVIIEVVVLVVVVVILIVMIKMIITRITVLMRMIRNEYTKGQAEPSVGKSGIGSRISVTAETRDCSSY